MPGQRPGKTLNGQVVSADGAPLSQADIQIRNWAGNLVATGTTDMNGQFSFPVMGDGPFVLHVTQGSVTESQTIRSDQFDHFVVTMGESVPLRAKSPGATVSLNDLEASGKAKSALKKAEDAINKDKLDKAWTLANQAIDADPNWGQAYMIRGVLNLQNRKFEAAESDLQRAVKSNPKNTTALTELGKLYSTIGQYGRARLELEEALRVPPVLWPTYYEMASLAYKTGKWSEAETMATDAEYATPNGPPAVEMLAGMAAYQQQHWGVARQQLKKFVQDAGATPKDAKAVLLAQSTLARIPAAADGTGSQAAGTPAGDSNEPH